MGERWQLCERAGEQVRLSDCQRQLNIRQSLRMLRKSLEECFKFKPQRSSKAKLVGMAFEFWVFEFLLSFVIPISILPLA